MIIFLGDEDGYEDIISQSKDDPDIVVSCQYRHKVPRSLIDNYPCVNIHYGTLPFYAGCNPIYWQIMKGSKAGVTLHYMDENFDSGDIIKIWECPIGKMTADELYITLKNKGRELLKSFYSKIIKGTAPRSNQDLRFRRYYNKDEVDFDERFCKVDDINKLRAMHFEGKQYPIVNIGGRNYEVKATNKIC